MTRARLEDAVCLANERKRALIEKEERKDKEQAEEVKRAEQNTIIVSTIIWQNRQS